MKQINLLPLRVKQRRSNQKGVPYYGSAVIAAVAAVLLFRLGSQEVLSLQQTELSRLQDLSRPATAAKEIPKADQADTIQRVTYLNSLSAAEVNWEKIFPLISGLVPKDAHLTTYSVANGTGIVQIRLSGEVPSNYSFAVFSQALLSDPDLKNVKVESYSYAPAKGTVTFSISLGVPASRVSYSSPHS